MSKQPLASSESFDLLAIFNLRFSQKKNSNYYIQNLKQILYFRNICHIQCSIVCDLQPTMCRIHCPVYIAGCIIHYAVYIVENMQNIPNAEGESNTDQSHI